jgi:excinuclease ABC subunit A
MGPEGGDGGGIIVAQGTPEDIAASEASHTGRFLREVLKRRPLKREAAVSGGKAVPAGGKAVPAAKPRKAAPKRQAAE